MRHQTTELTEGTIHTVTTTGGYTRTVTVNRTSGVVQVTDEIETAVLRDDQYRPRDPHALVAQLTSDESAIRAEFERMIRAERRARRQF